MFKDYVLTRVPSKALRSMHGFLAEDDCIVDIEIGELVVDIDFLFACFESAISFSGHHHTPLPVFRDNFKRALSLFDLARKEEAKQLYVYFQKFLHLSQLVNALPFSVLKKMSRQLARAFSLGLYY